MTGCLVIGAALPHVQIPRTGFSVPCCRLPRLFARYPAARFLRPKLSRFFLQLLLLLQLLLPASRYPPSPLRRIPRLFARFPEHVHHVPSFPGFLGRHCVGYRGFLRFPKARSARGVVGGYYRIMPLSFSDGAKRLHRQKGCAERARGRIRPWGKET